MPPYNYRIEFPRGTDLDGRRDANFNHFRSLLQYTGMSVMRSAGQGAVGSEVDLCRIWLNADCKSNESTNRESGQVYVRMEKLNDQYADHWFGNADGNVYRAEYGWDTRLGSTNLSFDYFYDKFSLDTNNPYTAWHEITNLAWTLTRPASEIPDIITNVVDIRQWSRMFAVEGALPNGENGIWKIGYTVDEEYGLYADPSDGLMKILPWDCDSVVDPTLAPGNDQIQLDWSVWMWATNGGGAAENNVTFGRYTRSDGVTDFTAMSTPSLPGANPYPKVGPVVINEVMYNPAAGGKEFIELRNISGSTVPLYDPANPHNTWEFDGAMEYSFPFLSEIGTGEYILIVSTTPAEFRALFGINPAIDIYGPFDGALANGGESVKLLKPGTPELDGFVPYILVDKVKYDDDPPWPMAADNTGPSLERITSTLYGNDPTNWVAATLGGTPGEQNNSAGLPSISFFRPDAQGYESNMTIKVEVCLYPPSLAAVTVNYTVGGTAPNNPFSVFAVGMQIDSNGCYIYWPSSTGRVYSVYRAATMLGMPGTLLINNYPGQPSGTNTYYDQEAVGPTRFYRIRVRKP